MNFNFNHKYYPIIDTNARYIDVWGGRARGASHGLTDIIIYWMITQKYFRCYIMRQIFNDIRGSIWRDLMDRLNENCSEQEKNLFKIAENEMSITCIPNGNTITAKAFKKQSGGQTAKLKSLAGASHVLIEEADEIERYDFEKLDDSVRTKKSQNVKIIRLFNSPSKEHWIIKNWYKLHPHEVYNDYFVGTPVQRNDFLSIFGTFQDNYENIADSTLDKINKYKNSDKDLEFEHYLTDYLGLISAGNKGRVYKNYTLFKSYESEGLFRCFAQDWGGNDPNATLMLDFDKKLMRVYLSEICYESEIKNEDQIALIKKVNPENHEVICDNARIDKIREFQYAKINAFGIKKGVIEDDISIVKRFELYVNEKSINLRTELENYVWDYDKINDIFLNKPIDKYNHLLDGLKYACKWYFITHCYNL